VDLSALVKIGTNEIEFRRPAGLQLLSLQIVSNYYIPWQTNGISSGTPAKLKLETHFDKLETRISGEITCRVRAERLVSHGHGMLLAEIGLPPGVDVDRASLDLAVKESDDKINRYDVLPDRVVVYLWPRAGGVDFSFKFRPRFEMTAKSAPSVLYDYYNPEAKAVVAPQTFKVN
jgi:hypothetical protein